MVRTGFGEFLGKSVSLHPRGGTRSIHEGGVRRSFILQTQKNTQA